MVTVSSNALELWHSSHLAWALGTALCVGYLTLVRLLRYRRRDSTQTRYGFTDRQSFAGMTLHEAFEIQLPLAELEFPTVFSVSVFFALFKTYGIPAISELLVATGELSDAQRSSKRAADTGVLITEFVLNRPGTDRNLDALSRMNWLHDRYRRAGKIKDEDMLYTLGLFALEPIRWTNRFDWRRLTDLERCAMAVYWKYIGEAMEIPYTPLPSYKSGWKDGLEWIQELEDWCLAYEAENVVPAESNRVLAQATVDIGLTNVPRVFHGLVRQFAAALLDQRLRTAMKMEDPPAAVELALNVLVAMRAWLVRNLFLPRPQIFRAQWFSSQPNPSTGRYNFKRHIGYPWYIRPSMSQVFSPKTWLLWISGGYVASWNTPEYRPEGYKILDVGPVALEGKGTNEMDQLRSRTAQMFSRCPMSHKAVPR